MRHTSFTRLLSGLPLVYVEPIARSLLILLPGQTIPTSLVGFESFMRRLLPDLASSERSTDLAVRPGFAAVSRADVPELTSPSPLLRGGGWSRAWR